MSLSSIGHPSYAPGYGRPATPSPASAPSAAAPPPGASAPLASTARLLGLSPDQLGRALRAGTSLHQLAVYTGVSTDAVHGSVHTDLRHDAPDDGAALTDDQLEQIAAGIQSDALPAAVPAPAATPVRFDSYA